MNLRPLGIIQSGELRLGLEVVREEGRIVSIRPHRGVPEPCVLSVPFVNAHSHLEYRGLQGRLDGLEYWPWIRELTRLKSLQTCSEVQEHCRMAAMENRRTGVGLIGEHSDRPFSGQALAEQGIGGVIFQEVITFFERESPFEKLRAVASNAQKNAEHFKGAVTPSPHALYTVDEATLKSFGRSGAWISLHLAESAAERSFFEQGEGPIAEFFGRSGVRFKPEGSSPLDAAHKLGLVRQGAQLVHCCDLSGRDVKRLAQSGASIAHCPRSNQMLKCPQAPVRQLLRTRVDVGLGMDSAASSGPIDMFAEMRAAFEVASLRGEPLVGDEVWNMATTMGARTIGIRGWNLQEGFEGPLIAIDSEGCHSTEELILKGSPEKVRWIE